MFAAIGYMGPQPFNDWFTPDTNQRMALGLMLSAIDPYWGGGAFVYGKAGGTITKGDVCICDETFTFSQLPNTANQGFTVAFAMNSMAANTFGWFQKSGRVVYRTTATVAADALIGITGAGTLGANSAGKEIVGIRNRIPATGTVVKTNVQVKNGYNILLTSGYDGFFLGMALSGTNIPASTVVAKLDPDGRTVYMGSAIGTLDKFATGTGVISLTGTYTGYGSGIADGAFAQGAIT